MVFAAASLDYSESTLIDVIPYISGVESYHRILAEANANTALKGCTAMIEFSKEEKEAVVARIQMYFREELDQDIGQFDAEFLLDFFSEEVGAYFYNRGLHDAQAVLESKLEDIADAIYEIEKPTNFRR